MTESASTTANSATSRSGKSDLVAASLRKRYAAERRFKLYGIAAVLTALFFVGLLFTTIFMNGMSSFSQTMVTLDVTLHEQDIDPEGARDPKVLQTANYRKLVRQTLFELFPDVTKRRDKRKLAKMISPGAPFIIRDAVIENPDLIGQRVTFTFPMSDDIDQFYKGTISSSTSESDRRVSNQEIGWLSDLTDKGLVDKKFNATFFSAGDSREPELAGIRGAAVGSFLTLLVTLVLSFPIGIASAVYLEEFAPKNRITQIIEVNINNLAAVPSIVFGLLGLAIFLNFFGLPRSAPLVGGMVLALMTLPTIIIAGRAALKAVPPSIREAALGMGASRVQTVTHHVLPLAMPGMLTGAIIGMAQALGETAPLLMIGMVAFIVDIPGGVTDPSTVLPVQIYLWADSPERAFVERTSGAIIVLLGFLVMMNAAAVILRKKFEKKW